jgi:hypothetical protein
VAVMVIGRSGGHTGAKKCRKKKRRRHGERDDDDNDDGSDSGGSDSGGSDSGGKNAKKHTKSKGSKSGAVWQPTIAHFFARVCHDKDGRRVFTQNIDGLDLKAFASASAAAGIVVPVHGSLGVVSCEHCGADVDGAWFAGYRVHPRHLRAPRTTRRRPGGEQPHPLPALYTARVQAGYCAIRTAASSAVLCAQGGGLAWPGPPARRRYEPDGRAGKHGRVGHRGGGAYCTS